MPFFYGNPGSFASIVSELTTTLTVNNATTNTLLDLNQTAAATVIDLDNDSTGLGIFINQDGVLGASKYALYVYSNTAQVTSPLVHMKLDHASSSTNVLTITNDGTGYGLQILQNGTQYAQRVDQAANERGIIIFSAATTKPGLDIQGTGVFTGTGSSGAFNNSQLTNASATGDLINLLHAGTGIVMRIDHNNSGQNIFIDQDVNDANSCYGLVVDIQNAGAGLEYAFRFNGSEIVAAAVGGSQDQKIRISIAGTDYFIPCHTA